MRKRILSLVLSLAMLVSMCAFSFNVSASDAPSDWALNEVTAAINKGLVTDKVTKDYQKEITREEFCELVVKLYETLTGENATFGDITFSDTDNAEILKAATLGIVKGVSETEFAPDNNITRQEICVMLTRCIDIAIDEAYITAFEEYDFADKNEIADWAIDSVNYAFHNYIMKGVGDNRINPLGNTTCEQAILLIYRIYAEYKECPAYETAYLEYIKNNVEYFSRGMMLCDLNDDTIPELFSIAYDEKGDLVYCYAFKDNAVVAASAKTYINVYDLIHSKTFFENTDCFIGIYENKTTGQKALINSVAATDGDDRLDVITYDGENLVLKDEGVKSPTGIIWPLDEKRDAVMADYELADNELYASFLLRGEFGGEHGSDPVAVLKELIREYKNSKTTTKYEEFADGEFFCYVKNINLTDNEIELVPVSYITYEQYNNAINSDKIVTLNEETMSIQLDEFLYNELGIASLYQMPGFEYSFYVPTEERPTSIIEGYFGNAPVKVKMSNALKIRYGVLGEYNSDGTPTNYETLGRNKEYTMPEYLPHFAEYSFGSYYKAVVKNNELVFLDVFYHQ